MVPLEKVLEGPSPGRAPILAPEAPKRVKPPAPPGVPDGRGLAAPHARRTTEALVRSRSSGIGGSRSRGVLSPPELTGGPPSPQS